MKDKDKGPGCFDLDRVTYGSSTDFGTGQSGLYSKKTNVLFDNFRLRDGVADPPRSRVSGESRAVRPPARVYTTSGGCLPSSASPGYDSR